GPRLRGPGAGGDVRPGDRRGRGFARSRTQDRRRGDGARCRAHRRRGDGLVGRHGGGGLDPHPGVVGLVHRDRNRVDAEEVGGDQGRVGGPVRGQFGHGRHGRQGRGVGRGGGLELGTGRGGGRRG